MMAKNDKRISDIKKEIQQKEEEITDITSRIAQNTREIHRLQQIYNEKHRISKIELSEEEEDFRNKWAAAEKNYDAQLKDIETKTILGIYNETYRLDQIDKLNAAAAKYRHDLQRDNQNKVDRIMRNFNTDIETDTNPSARRLEQTVNTLNKALKKSTTERNELLKILEQLKQNKKKELLQTISKNETFIPVGIPPNNGNGGFNGPGGKANIKYIILPKGTLLFSGYKQRNNDTKSALNDFMNLYLRGMRSLDTTKNQMCSSAPLNAYGNFLFFHPCPFFANGVAGYDFNSQGCWVVKSDIKLVLLYGYEMNPPIHGLERAGFRNSHAQPGEMNDFFSNSCSNMTDSDNNFYPWKTPSFLNGTKDFDPCLFPPWMYDNEVNGYITVAGADATSTQNAVGKCKDEPALINMSRNNLHAWGTNSSSDERFINYLNIFTSVMKKSQPDGTPDKYTYGIPEIVLFSGSFKFIKDKIFEIPRPDMAITSYNNKGRNITTWRDQNVGLINVTSQDKKTPKNRLSTFLSTNSDGVFGACEGNSGIPKGLQTQFNNDFRNFFEQNKTKLFQDMQIVYPLFSGISNQSTNSGINDEVNQIINKIFHAMRKTNNIKYDNFTGFFVDYEIFMTTNETNYQPIKQGTYSTVLISDRKAYSLKWLSGTRMNLLDNDGNPSPATFWLNSIKNNENAFIINYKSYIHSYFSTKSTKFIEKIPDFIESLTKNIENKNIHDFLIKKKKSIIITKS